MIKFFQKIFKKTPPAPVQPVPVPRAAPEPAAPVVKVETASLSLAAILSRFPTDLKETIAKPPDPSVMVALPLSIILKQLPSGSVKMSLVSIYRQAPPGTFTAPRMEEKRLVEVPLGEIFKRVKPELLKRRDDQRMNTLAEDDSLDVFGDPNNPFMVSPVGGPVPAEEPPAESYEEAPTEPNTIPTARAVGMLPTAGRSAQPDGMRVVQPPPGFGAPIARPAAPVAPPPAPTVPVLVLPLVDISAGWPEAARVEFPSGPAAVVSLPLDEVAKGLAKGRVSFTWGQIRSWISPAILEASRLPQDLEIQLPLRVVAPAFLKSGKQ
ncbi:MAG: hypothetical protein V4710_01300, partial [Verrucomicrobiota bacterium]